MRASAWYRSIAAIVIVCFSAIGLHQPLLAAASAHNKPEVLAGLRGVTSLSKAQVADARRDALAKRNSSDPKVAARAKHTILLLDIFEAKSAAQRHRLVQQLPVVVKHRDTVSGTIVTFTAGGKDRLQFSIPTTPSKPDATGSVSGPSDRSTDDDCYDGPGPCSSWEEMDDAAAVLADTEADLESQINDIDSAGGEYDDFCSQNPDACNGGIPVFASGPSAESGDHWGCVSDIQHAAETAVGSLATVTGLSIGLEAAAGAGITLSQATLWGCLATAIGAGGVTGIAAGLAIYCVYKAVHVREPLVDIFG